MIYLREKRIDHLQENHHDLTKKHQNKPKLGMIR